MAAEHVQSLRIQARNWRFDVNTVNDWYAVLGFVVKAGHLAACRADGRADGGSIRIDFLDGADSICSALCRAGKGKKTAIRADTDSVWDIASDTWNTFVTVTAAPPSALPHITCTVLTVKGETWTAVEDCAAPPPMREMRDEPEEEPAERKGATAPRELEDATGDDVDDMDDVDGRIDTESTICVIDGQSGRMLTTSEAQGEGSDDDGCMTAQLHGRQVYLCSQCWRYMYENTEYRWDRSAACTHADGTRDKPCCGCITCSDCVLMDVLMSQRRNHWRNRWAGEEGLSEAPEASEAYEEGSNEEDSDDD